MRSLLKGGIEALRNEEKAVNDWWGISTGMVNVTLDENLPAGQKQLAAYLEEGILSGTIDPFRTEIRDLRGSVLNDGSRVFSAEELIRMDWLCENVEGEIPAFDELLPQSQNLVRLLGVYRESIPPETREPSA